MYKFWNCINSTTSIAYSEVILSRLLIIAYILAISFSDSSTCISPAEFPIGLARTMCASFEPLVFYFGNFYASSMVLDLEIMPQSSSTRLISPALMPIGLVMVYLVLGTIT